MGFFALLGRGRRDVFARVAGAMMAGTVLAYLTAWWQVEVLAGLPMDAPERHQGAWVHGGAAVAAGAIVAKVAAWLRRRAKVGVRSPQLTSLAALAAAVLLVLTVDLGIGLLVARDAPAANREDRPGRVVVVGLDGMTLRVLSPLLRAGEMPTFQRFVNEGAWGSFLTYGTASSPRVWTSMATGKRVRDHGIDDFVKATHKRYRAAPMRLLRSQVAGGVEHPERFRASGRAGRLVDHLPARNRRRLCRLATQARRPRWHLPAPSSAASWSSSSASAPTGYRAGLLWEADAVFTTAHHLLAKEPLDFLAIFDATIDRVEHRTWRDFQPERFDARRWPPAGDRDPTLHTLIPDVYRHLDRKLGELMSQLDDDALVIVVSDHGQLAAARPRVRLRLNRLLEQLGYAPAPPPSGRSRRSALCREPRLHPGRDPLDADAADQRQPERPRSSGHRPARGRLWASLIAWCKTCAPYGSTTVARCSAASPATGTRRKITQAAPTCG